MPTEVSFIHHCDEPCCSLGGAEYTCPSCGKYIHDYGDLWWQYYEDNSTLSTKGKCGTVCPECGEVLVVTHNKESYVYEIEIYKDEDK